MARIDNKTRPKGASAKKQDISSNINDLWNRIGKKLKSKGTVPSDVGKAIKAVRKGNC